MTLLPKVVYQMCVNGALIVGSTAKMLNGETDRPPGDFDLLVPFERWSVVCMLVPRSAKLNGFGGWTFNARHGDDIVSIDVWPDTLQRYLSECKSRHGGTVTAVDFINNRVFTMSPLAVQ